MPHYDTTVCPKLCLSTKTLSLIHAHSLFSFFSLKHVCQHPAVDPAAATAPWFLGTTTNSVALLALHDQPDGVFVIRHSITIPGSFVLSFR